MEALVAVASQNMRADLAPAPLFLKKRQLAVRVTAMLREVPMSNAKLMIRGAAAVGVVALTVASAMWLLPLQLAAQSLPDGQGVTVNAGAPLLHRTPIYHPGGTVTGTVTLDASLSAKGEVTDARVINGPEELRKAVLANVLNWHYASQPAPPTSTRVIVTFAQPAAGTALTAARVPVAVPAPPPPPAPSAAGRGGRGGPAAPAPQGPGVIFAIRTDGLSPELARLATDALGVRVGDTLPTPWDPTEKLRAVDVHLHAVRLQNGNGSFTILLALDQAAVANPPGAQAPVTTVGQTVQRVSSGVARGLLIKQVAPAYPPIARQARVQGAVLLSVIIGKEGNVKNISVVSGPAMLRQAALDAVSQWVYKPMLLNGQPAEVLTEVEVNFALADLPREAQ